MESLCGFIGLSPDVLQDAVVAVVGRFAWPPLLDAVPFLRGAFFKAGTFGLCVGSVNLRIRSRTELVRLNCSRTPSFFSAVETQSKCEFKSKKKKTTSLELFHSLNLGHLISSSHHLLLHNSHPSFPLSPGLFPSPLFYLWDLSSHTSLLYSSYFNVIMFIF